MAITVHPSSHALKFCLPLFAVAVICWALFELEAIDSSVSITRIDLAGTPMILYRPRALSALPVVVIAHGFAGSQQLMQSFALTFARNGYEALTFDFPGHGRNAKPLSGSIIDPNGATRMLVEETRKVVRFARTVGDGRIVVLGHSMASDIVVRFAETEPAVAATIAVSMFSPQVTATSPRNLLVIVGAWEGTLKREAIRAVSLATAPAAASSGVTYGDTAIGTGRRVAVSAHVEHVSVLFSHDSMKEALAWVDATFAYHRTEPPVLVGLGGWILLLVAGSVALAHPLSRFLPRVMVPAVGANLGWRRLWVPLTMPMLATPLFLRVLPTHFLPVLVGDYLAAHFALYGILTALALGYVQRGHPRSSPPASTRLLATASLAVIAYGFVAIVWPLDAFVTSFVPGPGRIVLLLALLAGTVPYFLSDEWLTRGAAGASGAYAVSKIAFLVSLAIAVALDLERLFFLIIIIPVILLFFLVYGLFSKWVYSSTGHPFVAGFANAVAFAWAIGVTFPLLAG